MTQLDQTTVNTQYLNLSFHTNNVPLHALKEASFKIDSSDFVSFVESSKHEEAVLLCAISRSTIKGTCCPKNGGSSC